MKLLLLALVAIAAGVSPAFAEQIKLSSLGIDGPCGVAVPPYQVVTVNIAHLLPAGFTSGSMWTIANTAPADLIPLGSSFAPFSVTGDPYSGTVVRYGECISSSLLIGQLSFFKATANNIPGCYQLNVVGYDGEPGPAAFGCDDTWHTVTGGFFTFDPLGKPDCYDCTTATQPSTWGSVKALYR
jgi:hypothetical protein